jgi:hypothetical protein
MTILVNSVIVLFLVAYTFPILYDESMLVIRNYEISPESLSIIITHLFTSTICFLFIFIISFRPKNNKIHEVPFTIA